MEKNQRVAEQLEPIPPSPLYLKAAKTIQQKRKSSGSKITFIVEKPLIQEKSEPEATVRDMSVFARYLRDVRPYNLLTLEDELEIGDKMIRLKQDHHELVCQIVQLYRRSKKRDKANQNQKLKAAEIVRALGAMLIIRNPEKLNGHFDIVSQAFTTERDSQVLLAFWSELKQIKRERLRTRDDLIQANLRLPVKLARKYVNRGVAFHDLVQEGNMALLHVANKWNVYHKNDFAKFATYATWWIEQHMGRAICNTGGDIRIPVHIHDIMRTIRKTITVIEKEQRVTKPVSLTEVAAKIGVAEAKLTKVIRLYKAVALESLDRPIGENEDATIMDLLAIEKFPSPQTNTENIDAMEIVSSVMTGLPPRSKKILGLRFGIGETHCHTLEEIGNMYDLSRERVRQIIENTLTKLRHPARIKKLLPLLS